MIDYIEEMMRTAGVELLTAMGGVQRGGIVYDVCTIETVYPDFTAVKQLEIIKLIGKVNNTITKMYAFPSEENGLYWHIAISSSLYGHNKVFSQALAQLTTELMNAGELDKEKVKEILEE